MGYDSNRDGECDAYLPALDTVLFAGASAGGNGVKHNADRLGAALTAANPSVDFRAVDVMLHHLSTPYLHRMDLQDPTSLDHWLAGFGTRHQLADAVEAQLRAMAVPAPQVFGPICGVHVGLDNDRAFRCQQIGAANGPTYHDTLWNWVNGVYLAGTMDIWQGGTPSPFCGCP